MKTLVTGATGFIGGALVKKLLDLGHDIRILSRSGNPPEDLAGRKLDIFKGDVADRESVQRATSGCKYVFHLAGVVGYKRSLRVAMQATNVTGTNNIVEACIQNNVQKLFYMSSVVAIGAGFQKEILTENSKYNLAHLDLGYFQTKHQAEEIVKIAVRAGKLDARIANPTTVYGAGDAKKASRSVHVKVAQGNFKFYTDGGANVLHIDDCLDGILKIFDKGRPGERYVLGGENLTLKEIFNMIAEAAGSRAPFIPLPTLAAHALGNFGDWQERLGTKALITSENAWTATLYHWFSNEKAKKELGFNARPSRLAINESVAWMREHKVI